MPPFFVPAGCRTAWRAGVGVPQSEPERAGRISCWGCRAAAICLKKIALHIPFQTGPASAHSRPGRQKRKYIRCHRASAGCQRRHGPFAGVTGGWTDSGRLKQSVDSGRACSGCLPIGIPCPLSDLSLKNPVAIKHQTGDKQGDGGAHGLPWVHPDEKCRPGSHKRENRI